MTGTTASTDAEESTVMTDATARTTSVKDASRDIVEGLPEEATQDDVHFQLD